MAKNLESILKNHPIEVDTSTGYWEENAGYWTEGEVVEYWHDPEDGICISVKGPDGRGTNWISHEFYCEREYIHPETESWYRNNYERYINKLEPLINRMGIRKLYDLSNWKNEV